MVLNMSEELVEVIINSLNCSKQTLKRQVANAKSENKKSIAQHQLEEVQWVLDVLEGR